jgi:hypothetical protein
MVVRVRDIIDDVSSLLFGIGNIEIFESIGGAPVVVATYIQFAVLGVDQGFGLLEVCSRFAAKNKRH